MTETRGGTRRIVSGLGLLVTRTIGRWIPDPFVLAIGLTAITAILAMVLPGTFAERSSDGPSKTGLLIDAWWGDDGLWKLLQFGMQMILVLVTGYALASSPPVRRLIGAIADLPASTATAAALVAFVAVLTGLVNWGLALVVGALLARAVGRSLERRGIPCHYPLLVAAGYLGLLVWHGGFSGSAPLKMTTAKAASEILPAEIVADHAATGIPLTDTLLSPMNLFVSLGLLVIAPIICLLLSPVDPAEMKGPKALGIDFSDEESADPMPEKAGRGVETVLGYLLAIGLVGGFVLYLFGSDTGLGSLGLNQINAVMFGLGLLLHGVFPKIGKTMDLGRQQWCVSQGFAVLLRQAQGGGPRPRSRERGPRSPS